MEVEFLHLCFMYPASFCSSALRSVSCFVHVLCPIILKAFDVTDNIKTFHFARCSVFKFYWMLLKYSMTINNINIISWIGGLFRTQTKFHPSRCPIQPVNLRWPLTSAVYNVTHEVDCFLLKLALSFFCRASRFLPACSNAHLENIHTISQEIPRFLWKRQVHYRVSKSPLS